MRVKNDAAASANDGENEYHWKAGSTVEVPDNFAAELFTIADGGFYDPKNFTEVDPAGAFTEVDPHEGPNTEPGGVVDDPKAVLTEVPPASDPIDANTGRPASENHEFDATEAQRAEDALDAIKEGTTPDKAAPKRGAKK